MATKSSLRKKTSSSSRSSSKTTPAKAKKPRSSSAKPKITGKVQPGDGLKFTNEVHRRLKKHFGPVETPLTYKHPHELSIAVILSAQCTDARVNIVTPALFKRFPEPKDYYQVPVQVVEELIFSTGFYKNKARSIQGFCRMLVEEFDGKLPSDIKTLQKMPGVGRKTANVISQELFGNMQGVVVDTHVGRISKLLGLTQHKDPVKIERDLIPVVRQKIWREWALYLIFLGRFSCKARKPDCSICPLNDICPSSP